MGRPMKKMVKKERGKMGSRLMLFLGMKKKKKEREVLKVQKRPKTDAKQKKKKLYRFPGFRSIPSIA